MSSKGQAKKQQAVTNHSMHPASMPPAVDAQVVSNRPMVQMSDTFPRCTEMLKVSRMGEILLLKVQCLLNSVVVIGLSIYSMMSLSLRLLVNISFLTYMR